MAPIGGRALDLDPSRRPPFLRNAEQEALERGFYDIPIVDVDSHVADEMDTRKLIGYMRNPNLVRAFDKYRDLDFRRVMLGFNVGDRAVAARSKAYGLWEDVPEQIPEDMPRTVAVTKRFMDRTAIDYLVSFPTIILSIGAIPQRDVQADVVGAYNRWLVEDIIPWDRRILAMPFLPMSDPGASLETVQRYADSPNVVGWMVTSARAEPVYEKEYLPLWDTIEQIGKPVAFHSGPHWKERPFEVLGRFFGAHALGFSFYSMLYCSQIVLSGLVERFPKIKWMFIESGQTWIPYVMSRMDQQYRRRSSEAPLLQRLPSEYVRDMYFTTQPFEEHWHDPDVGRAIFDLTNGPQSWLYASDYPHHDFDVPGLIWGTSYLTEAEKRAVLGENALKLFNLPNDLPTRTMRGDLHVRA